MKATTSAKRSPKSTKKATSASTKVNIYPNRMSLAVAGLAAVSLVLFALMMMV